MDFWVIIKLRSYPSINTRKHLFAHGESLHIGIVPFSLKNTGATFQRAMSYAFHDIKHIVEPYLDNPPAHSQRREDHPGHLRDIFLRCRHYNIWLNPHKCVFCIETGNLLGFVVSKDGIQIDPLKIAAILSLPTLPTF